LIKNIVINTLEKFHYDWLGNDRALGNLKSDNNSPKNKHNKNKNNVSGSKNVGDGGREGTCPQKFGKNIFRAIIM